MHSAISKTLEIVEYNTKYATDEELRDLCYRNFSTQININSFNGVYISMRDKYGNLFYFMFLGLMLSTFSLACLASVKTTDFSLLWVILTSAMVSMLCNYFIFGIYLVDRNHRTHKELGASLFKNLDFDERYYKKGGKFFLALLPNINDSSHQVVGHMGCVPRILDSAENPEKKVKLLHLEVFGVSQTIRGAGIGKKLVEEGINFAKAANYDGLTLYVWNINTAGQSLYKKFGFKVTNSFLHEPLTGLTRLEMTKMLN